MGFWHAFGTAVEMCIVTARVRIAMSDVAITLEPHVAEVTLLESAGRRLIHPTMGIVDLRTIANFPRSRLKRRRL